MMSPAQGQDTWAPLHSGCVSPTSRVRGGSGERRQGSSEEDEEGLILLLSCCSFQDQSRGWISSSRSP